MFPHCGVVRLRCNYTRRRRAERYTSYLHCQPSELLQSDAPSSGIFGLRVYTSHAVIRLYHCGGINAVHAASRPRSVKSESQQRSIQSFHRHIIFHVSHMLVQHPPTHRRSRRSGDYRKSDSTRRSAAWWALDCGGQTRRAIGDDRRIPREQRCVCVWSEIHSAARAEQLKADHVHPRCVHSPPSVWGR